jgi:hypothetical protein
MLPGMSELVRLRVYHFAPGAAFEGGLVAAIERMELLGDVKLLDALFVGRDPADGGLMAVDRGTANAEGTFASLLDFRLDPGRRQALTERTLADHPGGVPRPLIESIAATLEPGAGIFAVIHTDADATVLEEAVARSHGRQIADDTVESQALAEVGERLQAAASAAGSDA